MTPFVLGMLVSTVPLLAADPPKLDDAKAAVKKLAQAIGDATVKGDISAVFDHTYEPVLKALGGREAAEKQMKDVFKQMTTTGVAFKSYTVADPGELHMEEDTTYVVIPAKLEMTVPGGKLVVKTYLLGVSTNAGKTWQFADGGGLKDKKARDKVLPKLPAKLELPEYKEPEFVKEK